MNINDRMVERWGVANRTPYYWQRSAKRALRWRYEAMLNGSLGVYGQPTPPNASIDPVNLADIERAAMRCAGYEKSALSQWLRMRHKATTAQIANRLHDITQHYLNVKPYRRDLTLPIPIWRNH
ncbi:TPA: hypothetical protein ACGUPP_004317 [Vibrio vulnificus]